MNDPHCCRPSRKASLCLPQEVPLRLRGRYNFNNQIRSLLRVSVLRDAFQPFTTESCYVRLNPKTIKDLVSGFDETCPPVVFPNNAIKRPKNAVCDPTMS